MNAGAHEKVMKDIIINTTYIDRNANIYILQNSESEFGNRTSIFAKNKDYIVVSAQIKLSHGNKESIKEQMNHDLEIRREKQPITFPSAGSVFKRGEKYISAKLIDECGLKGMSVGDAQVSTKHAGFIINNGNAKAKDVQELVEIIKEKVYEKYNVRLETEIVILGDD